MRSLKKLVELSFYTPWKVEEFTPKEYKRYEKATPEEISKCMPGLTSKGAADIKLSVIQRYNGIPKRKLHS